MCEITTFVIKSSAVLGQGFANEPFQLGEFRASDVLPASFLALPHFNCHVTAYPPISYRGFAANCAIRKLVESLSRQRQKLHCVGAGLAGSNV
jgi:hypothetical protein